MAPPDPHNGARPGGGTGAGQESGREALNSEHHSTARPAAVDPEVARYAAWLDQAIDTLPTPRTMVDGTTSVVLIPAEAEERRGRTYSPLAVQLLDTERAADRLLEELGADHCRRLALALLELVQEVRR